MSGNSEEIVHLPQVADDAPTTADRQVLWFGVLTIGLTWAAWLSLAATSSAVAVLSPRSR